MAFRLFRTLGQFLQLLGVLSFGTHLKFTAFSAFFSEAVITVVSAFTRRATSVSCRSSLFTLKTIGVV